MAAERTNSGEPNPEDAETRLARCSCGALSVLVAGPPVRINACSCLDCQRRSGSAFSYTAFFPEDAVRRIAGAAATYREARASGRWHDSMFCRDCGVAVFCRLEALPGVIGIAVGTFGEPGFAPPGAFYWTSRRPHWLPLPDGIAALDRQ